MRRQKVEDWKGQAQKMMEEGVEEVEGRKG
jgi:hypothetical protein